MTNVFDDELRIDRRRLLRSGAAALVLGSAATSAFAASEALRVGSFFIAIDYAPYLIAKSQGLYDKLSAAPTNIRRSNLSRPSTRRSRPDELTRSSKRSLRLS